MKVYSSPSKFLIFSLAFVLALTAGIFAFGAASPSGHTGQALSLQALLHPSLAQSHLAPVFRQQKGRWTRASSGRFVYNRTAAQYRQKAHAATNGPVTIDEPVQTFDVFLPPPAFAPSDGPLTPVNLKPVWSADGSYFVFSSNRASMVASDPAGKYHLWVVSSAGDSATSKTLTQITSGSGNEFDPALNSSNNALTFTSDANSPGVRNLYAISFPPQSGATVDVTTLISLTNSTSGFNGVAHPTWSPDSARIAFSALTTTGATQNLHHIYYLYTASGGYLSSGGTNNPPAKLSDGMSDDLHPTWSPDGSYIFFDSTASAISATGNPIAPNPSNPSAETSPSMTSGAVANRSLFAISPSGTGPVKVTNTNGAQPATNDIFPALRTESDAQTVDLAFARSTAGSHSKINFVLGAYTFDPSTNIATAPNATAVQVLDSNDAADAYSDTQPVWSPVSSGGSISTVNSIAYASNRTITYNDPNTGLPLETPVSVPEGTTDLNLTVGASYEGILQSEIDQINPPTLLPYSGNEVVHVTDTVNLNTPRRNGDIQPGQQVKFTVRLSSREAGVDSNNVYIQIKDPDSRYQDADGLEHKVFTMDTAGSDDGSARKYLYNDNVFLSPSLFNLPSDQYGLPGTTKVGTTTYGPFFIFGVPAGFDSGNSSVGFYQNISGMPITIGHIPNGDTSLNPIRYSDPNSTASPKPMIPLPGVNPADFTSSATASSGNTTVGLGQEYEAQYLDAQFGAGGATNPVESDYGTPYYLAGVDDQVPHQGGNFPARPEWLHLTPVVPLDANGNPTPDANGGILYTMTWRTPTSPSDFYLDVIAYDKAIDPATQQSGPNFRIYDNVWGFSTQPFSGVNDILVVSDNALGQKFAASTFSGAGLAGLRPLFFGAESYMTDVDVNILPNAVFQYILPTGTMNQYKNQQPFGLYPGAYPMGGVAQDALPSPVALLLSQDYPIPIFPDILNIPVLNALGVGSYNEDALPGPVSRNELTIDGRSTPVSQQYSLWRILSRGAIPQNVLNGYAPSFVSQPAVDDEASPGINGKPAPFIAPAASIPNANRCVVWVSPFTGDQPLNQSGSLADPATQQTIENFLNKGGRLFVSGQDVGSSITVDGSTNNTSGATNTPPTQNFLPDFLSAGLASSNGATQTQTGTTGQGKRISSDAFVNVATPTFGNNSRFNTVNMFFPELEGDGTASYVPPGTSPLYLGNNYVGQAGAPTQWRVDGSLDQLGPIVQSFGNNQNEVLGAIDTLTPLNGAHTDITSGGAPTLVYNENTTTGARTVYAGFGLEGLSTEYYKVALSNPTRIAYEPRNLRQNILHNIVCYLRTGTFKGQVVNGAGGSGSGGVEGATVYLVPNQGVMLPDSRQTFSGTTDRLGNYVISGVEPGAYTVVAYKQGFIRSVVGVGGGGQFDPANSLTFAVEGDTTAVVNLNLTPAPKGSITGKVTDANSKPVNGATVTFVSADGQYTVTATSGVDGTYTINAVTPDSYTGTATDPPIYGTSTTQSATVASSQTVSGVNFILPAGVGTLGGLVTDANNNPIAGATVIIANTDGTPVTDAAGNAIGPFTTTTVSTPAAGATGDGSPVNYSGSVPPGTYLVTASGMGYTTSLSKTVVIKTVIFSRADFTLAAGPGVVGGLVTDKATGNPIVGATVTFTDANGDPVIDSNGNPVGPFTTTAVSKPAAGPAGDGQPLNFRGSVPPGNFFVTVSAYGYTTSQPEAVAVTTGAFSRVTPAIALVSSIGTLGGLVTDKATGKPIAGATVSVLNGAGNIVATMQTIATPTSPAAPTGDGSPLNYSFSLPAGTYSLMVMAAGHAQAGPLAVTVTTAAFARKDVPLSVSPGTLGGLVTVKGTTQVLAGAKVTLTNPDGTAVKDANGNAVGPFTTTAAPVSPAAPNGDGSPLNYSGSVPPGTYLVTVSAPNYTSSAAVTVTVVTNAFVRADAALIPSPGTLGGLVRNSAGAIIGGATINVVDANNNIVTTLTSANTASPTTAGSTGDGNPVNYSGPLTPGTYTVSVTAPGYGTSAGSSVKITSLGFTRHDFTVTSSLGTLGGLVTDTLSGTALNGAIVTITNSAGKIVATTTTTGTATSPAPPQGDNKPLNYSIPLDAGTYTVTLSERGYTSPAGQAVTVKVGGFARVDFTGTLGLAAIHTFPAGLNFFSVPYDYAGAGVGFDALFGTLNTGTMSAPSQGSNRSHVFAYDPSQLQYVIDPTAPADAPHLGQGYWVFLLAAHSVTTPAPLASGTSVAVSLKTGWNMIGVPSLGAISVSGTSGLHFANAAGGGALDFATAASNTYRLVYPTLYGYNGGYVPVTEGGTLTPWQAYWIYVYADTTVLIPTGS